MQGELCLFDFTYLVKSHVCVVQVHVASRVSVRDRFFAVRAAGLALGPPSPEKEADAMPAQTAMLTKFLSGEFLLQHLSFNSRLDSNICHYLIIVDIIVNL